MPFDLTPVPVPVGDCRCHGTPHEDGDVVFLAPMLSMAGGMAAQVAISEGSSDLVRLQELLARVYLSHGIVDWTFVDEAGDKLPVNGDTAAALLPYAKGGRLVADRADDLYAQDVLAPFIETVQRLAQSQRGSTRKKASSSPKRTSSRRRSTKTQPSPSST